MLTFIVNAHSLLFIMRKDNGEKTMVPIIPKIVNILADKGTVKVYISMFLTNVKDCF